MSTTMIWALGALVATLLAVVAGSAFRKGPGASLGGRDNSPEGAAQLARLLVAELALYNEEAFEGLRGGKLLPPTTVDDLRRSRDMYRERVGPEVENRDEIFEAEATRLLAKGNPELLREVWGSGP